MDRSGSPSEGVVWPVTLVTRAMRADSGPASRRRFESSHIWGVRHAEAAAAVGDVSRRGATPAKSAEHLGIGDSRVNHDRLHRRWVAPRPAG